MVEKDNIRMFITEQGAVIGEDAMLGSDALVKLTHPFRVFPNDKGSISVAALFVKEEWCTIPLLTSIEINVSDGFKSMYVDYEQKIFGSIITSLDKQIII